jgi:hypothetical protein
MAKKEKTEELIITNGNIIIINDITPSVAIMPKVDFTTNKVGNIVQRIKKLMEKFPNCNFHNSSFLYEKKYNLLSPKYNLSLSKWFQHYNVPKDENNNYIFYVVSNNETKNSFRKPGKNVKNFSRNKKKKNNKSRKLYR